MTARVRGYRRGHLLIDGLAGLAIIAIAYSLWSYLRGDLQLRRLMIISGVVAGIASLFQMTVGLIMSYRAGHGGDPDSIRTLFSVLNNGDTVKIALLAVMIGIASLLARRSEQLPGWLTLGGLIFAPLLAISGLAFPLNSDTLYASLEVTLLLLLTWAIATAVVVSRRIPTEEVPARAATASPAH